MLNGDTVLFGLYIESVYGVFLLGRVLYELLCFKWWPQSRLGIMQPGVCGVNVVWKKNDLLHSEQEVSG